MPNLPHNPHSSAASLRTYLAGVLPNSQLTVESVDSVHQPLLLMQTEHIIAGFAFSNGDMNASYDALYGSFKNCYEEHRERWDALDLAFVFCVQPDVPNLDTFCSSVETNVYFCRKFVIPLLSPLGASLARLPFLPLTPLNGKLIRPASAQTYLQRCGVPAVLAKYVVVQQARSPEGIVEDCTSGEFGEPQDLTAVASAPVAQFDTNTESVQLETVTIKNFRAYRKPQTFSVGADVTILYGPNGFGKTSFFDAVDFAVTGGINRIESSGDAHFTKTAQHLDSGSEESLVSLSFRCNSAARKIVRNVRDRKHPLLDGRSTDRKTILAELTGREMSAADRLEQFVNLFRATHLFSQEGQELTKNFQNDCSLSSEIVSRMLAFQDYANAVSKAARVCSILESTITNANNEIRELSEQITDDRKELDRLGQTARAHTNVHALDTEFDALRAKLVAAGFDLESARPDTSVVRGWRASIEARHAESQTRSRRISVLANETGNLPRMRADITSLQQQIAEKEQTLSTIDEKRTAAESVLQHAEQRLTEMNAKSEEAQARSVLLEWVRTTKPVYALLTQKQQTLVGELTRATDDHSRCRVAEETAASDLRARENQAVQVTEKLATKRTQLATLKSLSESIPSWQIKLTRLASVTESEIAAGTSLELLHTEEQQISPQLIPVTEEEGRLSRQVAEADKDQSELKTLLSQLQEHVQTGTCPLCGEEHRSKDELVRRISKHMAADAARGARADLTVVREKLKHLAEQLAANKQKQRALDIQITVLKGERTRLAVEIRQYANSAAELGIVIEESSPPPSELLQARLNRAQEEINELNRQVQETSAAVDMSRTVLANAKNILATKTAELNDRKVILARQQEELGQIQNDPRLAQISLDIDNDQLVHDERLNRDNLTGFKDETTKARTEVAQKKADLSTLRQESASLKTQLQTLRNQLVNIQRSLTQITARLEESKLPPSADEEMLLSLIATESRVQAQLVALRDSTSNLELAIDAATTAAALTTLQQNVRNKEKAIETAARKRSQHQPWLGYFTKLSHLVSSQQNEAITNFTSEYGPRTSVIQRRLRTVYGFDDIEIQSHESTIRVRVKRHGEELRPIDYFSQSQQQTLLLGLFLTACISQTWSGFSPVFMDDPVTHFDDLNTYAFLDLIVGLLESDSGKRQFIISTCDERLLQLARQKFRHLGERAVFYRFHAIGPEGPLVEKVNLT
jgi:exonuclease SbcC